MNQNRTPVVQVSDVSHNTMNPKEMMKLLDIRINVFQKYSTLKTWAMYTISFSVHLLFMLSNALLRS